MSQTKNEFCVAQINEMIARVINRESIPSNSESYDDLQWIKFYVKDLTATCKDCADEASGSQNDT